MGADFSWPCTDNRDNKKDFAFHAQTNTKTEGEITEDSDVFRQTAGVENRRSHERVLNKRDFLSPKYTRGHSGMSVDAASDSGYDGQSAGSFVERPPRVVITSQEIPDFKTFMDNVANNYENVQSADTTNLSSFSPTRLWCQLILQCIRFLISRFLSFKHRN